MERAIEQQYDRISEKFVDGTKIHNEQSREAYYSVLDFDLEGKRLLDIGCGDGYDIKRFNERGAITYGIDSSVELVKLAQENNPSSDITQGYMESLPYQDSNFDIVVSKYVLQTSRDLPKTLKEMDRVLKPNGILTYLAVHPIRQFLEKKKHPKDYFLQEVVKSTFFGGMVTASEPTHTLEEYLNSDFLSKYRITHFQEHPDFPSSERIGGDNYPCFFVLSAKKL